jgi:predicted 3-demethylubiquinone-9 3-methyltransferase (glyoxalase superfamily)
MPSRRCTATSSWCQTPASYTCGARPPIGKAAEIQRGWLRDRWGVPWQIVRAALPRLLGHVDRAVAARVFKAMQAMVKIDVAALERAAQG